MRQLPMSACVQRLCCHLYPTYNHLQFSTCSQCESYRAQLRQYTPIMCKRHKRKFYLQSYSQSHAQSVQFEYLPDMLHR